MPVLGEVFRLLTYRLNGQWPDAWLDQDLIQHTLLYVVGTLAHAALAECVKKDPPNRLVSSARFPQAAPLCLPRSHAQLSESCHS